MTEQVHKPALGQVCSSGDTVSKNVVHTWLFSSSNIDEENVRGLLANDNKCKPIVKGHGENHVKAHVSELLNPRAFHRSDLNWKNAGKMAKLGIQDPGRGQFDQGLVKQCSEQSHR